MKSSMKDKIQGGLHEVKGSIKEQVGKLANDRTLKVEGKAEKAAGQVQQRLGKAKDDVTKLRGKLSDVKKSA